MTDEELLKNGADDESTGQLISRYMPAVRKKASLMRNARVENDDLISEGFIGLLNAIRSYNPEKGSFSAFANTCIANSMKNILVKSSSAGQKMPEDFDFEEIEDKAASTEDLIIRREQKNEISGYISKLLSKREQQVFYLYLSSFSYGQISAKLGITPKAVDNAISRSKAKLRCYFKKKP